MTISRQSTLLLTLAIAVLTLGYANVSFAVKPVCPGTHPSCDGDEDPPESAAVYTAALTMGGFIFGEVVVTPSKRGNSYHSQDTLDMSRPLDDGSLDQMAWDSVFLTCPELLSGSIGGVIAGDSWTINISGSKLDGSVSNNPDSNILIRFRDVVAGGFLDVDIDFNLIGKIGSTNGAVTNFLPVNAGETSSFTLTQFVFFGDAKKGRSCRSGISDLLPNSVLEITRTQ